MNNSFLNDNPFDLRSNQRLKTLFERNSGGPRPFCWLIARFSGAALAAPGKKNPKCRITRGIRAFPGTSVPQLPEAAVGLCVFATLLGKWFR